jgi:hypothetical protein
LQQLKKELPVWAGIVCSICFGLFFLGLATLTDEPRLHRMFIAGGTLTLIAGALAAGTWAWNIYKGRVTFDDAKKSPEQINREADALLRKAEDLIRRNRGEKS